MKTWVDVRSIMEMVILSMRGVYAGIRTNKLRARRKNLER